MPYNPYMTIITSPYFGMFDSWGDHYAAIRVNVYHTDDHYPLYSFILFDEAMTAFCDKMRGFKVVGSTGYYELTQRELKNLI